MGSISPTEFTLPSNKDTCESLLVFWQEQDRVCPSWDRSDPLSPLAGPRPLVPPSHSPFVLGCFLGWLSEGVPCGGEQERPPNRGQVGFNYLH